MSDANLEAASVLKGVRVQGISFQVGAYGVRGDWFTTIADAISELRVRVELSGKGGSIGKTSPVRNALGIVERVNIGLPGGSLSDLQTQGLLVHEAIHAGFYLYERSEGRTGPPPPGFGGMGGRFNSGLPQMPQSDEDALAYLAQAFFLCADEKELEDALFVRRSGPIEKLDNEVQAAKWTIAEIIEGKRHQLHLRQKHFISSGSFHRLVVRVNQLA